MVEVQCRKCGVLFEPNPEAVKAWAESGKSFDPTDWECGDCQKAAWEAEFDAADAACQGCRWLVGDTCNGCCEDGFPLRAEEF